MAKMPDAAAPPADETDDSAAPPDDTGSDDADAGEGPDESEGDEVLVTITAGHDGTYMVYDGDEPDAQDSIESPDAGAAAPAAGADAGDSAMPEGKECDSMGAALKAAMDILKTHEESDQGSGSAASNFDEGFNGPVAGTAPGGSAAAPTGMTQKY